MASPHKARTIRYSKVFDSQWEAIIRTPGSERCDDLLNGVEWGISVNPTAHKLIPGTMIRIVKTEPFPGAPALRIYFAIDKDDHHCTIYEVHRIEEYDEED
jgi:hypothetical protein